jgi:hypothetical protein
LFFDVPFSVFTFVHYLEHHVRDQLHFSLYEDELYEVPVIDSEGNSATVKTYVFSREAIRRRRFPILRRELARRGILRKKRVGNTSLLAVNLESVIACVDDMSRHGVYFFDMSP